MDTNTKLGPVARRVLDEDTQILVEAGILDEKLELSKEGWKLISGFLVEQHMEELVDEGLRILEK